MKDNFTDMIFREITSPVSGRNKNIIKAGDIDFAGKCKIVTEEESHNGIKVILKKNENDEVREIKFVCSCGQAKSIQLDYAD